MKYIRFFWQHKEYRMIAIAIVIIALNYMGGWFWEMNIVDPQKFAKIAYAAIALSVGVTIVWIMMNMFSTLKDVIDPDTPDKLKELTTWQKALLAVILFVALLFTYCRFATS